MEYKIIENYSPKEFQEDVNKALCDGWQLQGGVAYTEFQAIYPNDNRENHYIYVQAVIKP